jgi:hypothetical protein
MRPLDCYIATLLAPISPQKWLSSLMKVLLIVGQKYVVELGHYREKRL